MIVECINDTFIGAPEPLPVKGNLYEVVHIEHDILRPQYSPFFKLKKLNTEVLWSHKCFREVDIDINQIEKVLQEPLKEYVMV
jgi:hypothetical protein